MVHCFKRLGGYYIYDVESGSLLKVNKLFYLVCKKKYDVFSDEEESEFAKFTEGEIKQTNAEVIQLEKDEIIGVIQPEMKPSKARRGIKALCINITHDCNLSCAYCFACETLNTTENTSTTKTQRSNPKRKSIGKNLHSKGLHSKGLYGTGADYLSLETGKKAIDFLIVNSGSRRNLEVDFFGGEPLLNFNVLKQVVEYARMLEKEHNKRFNFTVTTNCIALTDQHIEFINSEIFNVVLSIDGRKDVHDYTRNNSYDTVLANAKKLIALRGNKSYYVRGTFTNKNLDFSNDVLHLYNQGFTSISVEPVVLASEHDLSLEQQQLGNIDAEYEKLAYKILDIRKDTTKPPLNFFHFNVNLEGGPCVDKRITACGAGVEYLAVTPDGNLYPCHQFASNNEYLLGDVFTGLARDKMRVSDKFLNTTVLVKEDCRKCFAKYHCSGGCFAASVNICGKFDGVYALGCDMFRQRLEIALAMLDV